MEIKKEILPKSKVKLTVKITSPEMRAIFARVYNKLAGQVEIKGFRVGQAPKAMIISAIGENRIQSEIIDAALQQTYPEALKKENLVPIAPPKVNIKMMKDLTADTAELEYEAEIDLLPQISLGDYKKIKIKKIDEKDRQASEAEVEQILKHLAEQQATFENIDRPLKIGDRVEMTFEGYDKGVKLENLTSKNYPVILGSKVLIADFEEKLVDHKKGEKLEFKLDMTTGPDKAKKPIDFKVEILQTQAVILPKLDDEFAKKYQKATFLELKKAVEEDVLKHKEEQAKKNEENQVIEALLKITNVDLPESLIDQEAERQIQDIQTRVTGMGLTYEKYLESLKKTEEEFRQGLRPQAENTIKIGLALGEIIKKEGSAWHIDPKDKDAGKKVLEHLVEQATK